MNTNKNIFVLKGKIMKKLLYIESSPRKNRSASIEVAKSFLSDYKNKFPDHLIETIDLWQTELPPFDGDVINAKYTIMHQQSQTEEQRKAWRKVEEIIAKFKNADQYLISLPMWNFGIPYKLKHYIDLLVQPSYTFTFSPDEGYKGLITGKPVVLVYARGGSYGIGSGLEDLDLQKKYMETVLRFIGFTDIRSIVIEPTLAGEDSKEIAVKKAKIEAEKIVQSLE